MATIDPAVEARLAALEATLGDLQLSDLPLADLQNKLANDWQPDASVLLQPYSVTSDQIAANTVTAAQIAANTITAAQIAANTITPAQLQAAEAWHVVGAASQPAFTNAWVDFGAPETPTAFYKDLLGVVHLRGLVKSGTLNTAAFTLPVGYRPFASGTANVRFAVITNNAVGVAFVTAAGAVTPFSGSNVYFDLAGISFKAEG